MFFEEGRFTLLLQSNPNRSILTLAQCIYFVLLQEIEILKVELEASQRQLEGKDEALRILQSMVGAVQKSLGGNKENRGTLLLLLIKTSKTLRPSQGCNLNH